MAWVMRPKYRDQRRAAMLSGSAYFCLFAIRRMTRCINWAGCRPKGYDA